MLCLLKLCFVNSLFSSILMGIMHYTSQCNIVKAVAMSPLQSVTYTLWTGLTLSNAQTNIITLITSWECILNRRGDDGLSAIQCCLWTKHSANVNSSIDVTFSRCLVKFATKIQCDGTVWSSKTMKRKLLHHKPDYIAKRPNIKDICYPAKHILHNKSQAIKFVIIKLTYVKNLYNILSKSSLLIHKWKNSCQNFSHVFNGIYPLVKD